jgi:hypothetical protein
MPVSSDTDSIQTFARQMECATCGSRTTHGFTRPEGHWRCFEDYGPCDLCGEEMHGVNAACVSHFGTKTVCPGCLPKTKALGV